MNAEEAVAARLLAVSGVTDLVGTRVYQLILPQKPTLPAIRVMLIDEPARYHLRGGSVYTRARVQTDAYAATGSGTDPYAEAVAVGAAIDAALSGSGPFRPDDPATVEVTAAFRQSRLPMYEADELRLVRMMQDYIIWMRSLS